MAVRRWGVGPDPTTGIVDRQQLIEALMDGEALLWRAGGVLSILVGREPTGLPGEMVTTQAVIEWKDRTDARPQPERAGSVIAEPAAPPVQRFSEEEIQAMLPAEPEPGADDVADGLDPATLDEEDTSAIQEPVGT